MESLRGHKHHLAIWVVLAIGFQVAAPLTLYWSLAVGHQGYCHQHHQFESMGTTFNGSPEDSIPVDEALQHDDWSKFLFDLSHVQPIRPAQLVCAIEEHATLEAPNTGSQLQESEHPVIRAPKHSPPVS